MQRICVTPDVHLFGGLGGNLNPFLQQLSITQFPIVSTIFGYFHLWTGERDPGQAYHCGVRGEEHLAAGRDLKVGPTEKQGQLSWGYDEVMAVWANEPTGKEYVWNCCLTDCVVWDWENEPSINKSYAVMFCSLKSRKISERKVIQSIPVVILEVVLRDPFSHPYQSCKMHFIKKSQWKQFFLGVYIANYTIFLQCCNTRAHTHTHSDHELQRCHTKIIIKLAAVDCNRSKVCVLIPVRSQYQ